MPKKKQQGKKSTPSHSIKFSKSTDKVIEQMRLHPKHKRSFTAMVEYLVENNPEFTDFTNSEDKTYFK